MTTPPIHEKKQSKKSKRWAKRLYFLAVLALFISFLLSKDTFFKFFSPSKNFVLQTHASTKIHWDQEKLIARLSEFSTERLNRMLAAGKEIKQWERILKKGHTNVVKEILSGFEEFYEFDHYPKGDAIDTENLSQYYYHAHRSDEHGHFHLFLLQNRIPSQIRPYFFKDCSNSHTHFIAISMNTKGVPAKLFTVNHWVSGDTWYKAEDLCPLIDHFKIELPQPSWLTNQWLNAMVCLFYPQIVDLLYQRDRVLEEWQKQDPQKNLFEDRELEVLTEMPISVDEQIEAISKAVKK